jgi:hypothetical protein
MVLFIGLIGYVIISFINTQVKTDSRELYSNTFHQHYLINSNRVYENLLPSGELFSNAFIQSDIIQDNFLKLFVCHKRYFEQIYLGQNIKNLRISINELEKQGDVKETYRFINTEINNLYKVYIDDDLVDSIEWYFNIHPKTISNGVVSYIDIAFLSIGHHNVKIILPDSSQLTNIHFWKQ